MKKIILLTALVLLTAGPLAAQHGHGDCASCPHQRQHQQGCRPAASAGLSFDQVLTRAFPTMLSTKKEGKWTAVYNSGHKLLGFAVASKSASDGIRGYAGETPVVITFDAKKRITGVYLLTNQETPKFVQRVEQAGYFDNWNGLTVRKALKKKVDTVSGATFTSRAVAESVQAALAAL